MEELAIQCQNLREFVLNYADCKNTEMAKALKELEDIDNNADFVNKAYNIVMDIETDGTDSEAYFRYEVDARYNNLLELQALLE